MKSQTTSSTFYYTDPQGIRWELNHIRRSFTPGFVLADRIKDGKTIRITVRSIHTQEAPGS